MCGLPAAAAGGLPTATGRGPAPAAADTATPPGGGVLDDLIATGCWPRRRGYLTCDSIQSTVAITCSSVSAGLPPLGGITPPSGPV